MTQESSSSFGVINRVMLHDANDVFANAFGDGNRADRLCKVHDMVERGQQVVLV